LGAGCGETGDCGEEESGEWQVANNERGKEGKRFNTKATEIRAVRTP